MSISNQITAAFELPFTPWRNYFDVRFEGVIRQLKTDLIITLAGCAVRHSVCTFFARYFDLSFGDYRPGEGSAQKVNTLVYRVCLDRSPDVVANELFAQIFYVKFGGSCSERLRLEAVHFFTLPDVSAIANDFAAVLVRSE